jgi:hypothetical protein
MKESARDTALPSDLRPLEPYRRGGIVLACLASLAALKKGSYNPIKDADEYLETSASNLDDKDSVEHARGTLTELSRLFDDGKFSASKKAFGDLVRNVCPRRYNALVSSEDRDASLVNFVKNFLKPYAARAPTSLTKVSGLIDGLVMPKIEAIKKKFNKMCTTQRAFDAVYNTFATLVLLYCTQQILTMLGDPVLCNGLSKIASQFYFRDLGIISAIAGLGLTSSGTTLYTALKTF